jgi:signal peptidase I
MKSSFGFFFFFFFFFCLIRHPKGSESPIVVVLTGSMEPAIFRGDLVFLWLRDREAVKKGGLFGSSSFFFFS